MAQRLSDSIPGSTLFKYLTDDTLTAVESDNKNSVYAYECGCVAVRWIGSSDCYVRWCEVHRPRA